MKRNTILSTAMLMALAACGGGEPAADTSSESEMEPAAAESEGMGEMGAMGEMTMPDWFHVDEANQTVHMTITAGATDAKNYWNYNGYTDGAMTITVPEGYTVTIDFVNEDPNMAHSLGISSQTSGFGASLTPDPVFEGALSSNPISMVDATMPGESETIEFTASTAGDYAMVCYIPGHAATGMWVLFNVSGDGSAGVQTSM